VRLDGEIGGVIPPRHFTRIKRPLAVNDFDSSLAQHLGPGNSGTKKTLHECRAMMQESGEECAMQ